VRTLTASEMAKQWQSHARWNYIQRPYRSEDVVNSAGVDPDRPYLAAPGAERLWWLLHHESYVPALVPSPATRPSAGQGG